MASPVSGSSWASARELLELAGGDDRHGRLVGEHRQRLEPRAGGQQAILGIVGPDATDHVAGAVAQRDEQPVVVPRERAAAVELRDEAHVQGRQLARRLAREQVAAADLEGRVEQRFDGRRGNRPVRLLPRRPADARARSQRSRLGVDELDHDLGEPEGAHHAGAHRLEDQLHRVLAGKLGGHGQQLLERRAVARGLLGALAVVERTRGRGSDRDEVVELGVGRAPPADRLAERHDGKDVPGRVAAGHEELVPRTPRVGVRAAVEIGQVARAIGAPVDRALGNEVRAAAGEALVEHDRQPVARS